MTSAEINEIDGALWGLLEYGDGACEFETTIYRFTEKVTPKNEEIGSHKFHVLTFKPTRELETIEFMQAHIGDVQHFISNQARAGYNGVMVKDGCIPKKAIKDLIRLTFKNWELPKQRLNPILLQV
jgi:hypothetical protein